MNKTSLYLALGAAVSAGIRIWPTLLAGAWAVFGRTIDSRRLGYVVCSRAPPPRVTPTSEQRCHTAACSGRSRAGLS